MTGPDESQSTTRPISVAELLAKNGTLGAPPVTGRRRRRRGNADAVTVAELTGEIPVVRLGDEADEYVDEDVAPALELSEAPVARRGRDLAPERSHDPRPLRFVEPADPVEYVESDDTAESMSPDLLEVSYPDVQPDEVGVADAGHVGGSDSALFGGDTLADELSRGATRDDVITFSAAAEDAEPELFGESDDSFEAADEHAEDQYEGDYPEGYYDNEFSTGRKVARGLLTAAQSVLAVIFGAGLFLAFDQLWKWNSLIAMVLAILVTLGLVAGVWVVRKTEDIASTLTAVGVGLLVTFGPLALMQAG